MGHHPRGLAMDASVFIDRQGRRYEVQPHWEKLYGGPGHCVGPARTQQGRLLRQVICDLERAHIFRRILTPLLEHRRLGWLVLWGTGLLLAGAMLLLALHDGRMGLETSGSPSVRPALRWPVLAWALVPFVGTALLAPLAAAALERPAESVSREIRARDTWLFVFNPHCESCLAEARSLGPLASRGEVTGIAPAGVDGRERFFQRLGYRMPVEVVAGDLWFDLIESAPPAYYRVDSAGKLVAVDRSALLAAVR